MPQHKITLTLTEAEWQLLTDHATERGRTPEDDLKRIWYGRAKATADFKAKQADPTATFRIYSSRAGDRAQGLKAPKPAKKRESRASTAAAPTGSASTAGASKKRKLAEPVGNPEKRAKPREIDLYDSDSVALHKAKNLAEFEKKTVKQILAESGRTPDGKRIKGK